LILKCSRLVKFSRVGVGNSRSKIQNSGSRFGEASNGGFDLTLIGETPDLMFGKHQVAVHAHVEDPATASDEGGVDIEDSLEVGRQPGGSWLVISSTAIFDGNVHAASI